MTNDTQIHENACPEIEILAALVDGSLQGQEREQAVEHISRCESCYELFTETMRSQEEELEKGRVIAHPATRRPMAWAAAGVAVAAVLAITLVSPRWSGFLGTPDLGRIDATSLAEYLTHSTEAPLLLANASEGSEWLRVRGNLDTLTENQRAFRLGVRTVDLEIAMRANDKTVSTQLIHELSNTAQDLPSAEIIGNSYRTLLEALESGESPEALTDVSAAAAALIGELAEKPYYAMGQWAESGLLAASTGDTEFFNHRSVRRFASELEAAELPDELRAPLTTITERLEQPVHDDDLLPLTGAFAELVESGGNA